MAPRVVAGGVVPLAEVRPPVFVEPLGAWRLDSTGHLRVLRSDLHHLLGHRPVSGPVVLVASELATNALRHGAPPAAVTLGRTAAGYVLDVADGDVGTHPALAARRPLGEGGFGLYLAGRLADELGWYVEAGLKHVWAAFVR